MPKADKHRERGARQPESRLRADARHQSPAQPQVQRVHRQDVEQDAPRAQVRPHHGRHARVAGVETERERGHLQAGCGERQHVRWRAQDREQRSGARRDADRGGESHPGARAERGPRSGVRHRAVAGTSSCVIVTLTARLMTRSNSKNAACTLLASAKAPDAASDVCDASASPTRPTEMPSSDSPKSGHAIC
jgi:hypothetical protein